MRLLVYTMLRLGLVVAAAGVLYLLGLRSWILWIAAVVVGALLSFVLFGRQREDAASVLAQYDPLREERPTFSPKAQEDAAYEDAVVDAHAPGSAGDDVRPGGSAVVPGEAVGEESAETGPAGAGPDRPADGAGSSERRPSEDR
ncbi:DUF4229 domain-containing protein [Georgenia daeguensis]|uniref:DUF4229 domain-containing protein n=1 Tax=Georgenia daeguensis TaxID=908355 RepID=A0ABP8ETA6_9MICO